jgi:hypothetical protein
LLTSTREEPGSAGKSVPFLPKQPDKTVIHREFIATPGVRAIAALQH